MTAATALLQRMDRALAAHHMTVVPVPDYGKTNWVAVCLSCEYEHVQVTTREDAEADVRRGCPIARLEQDAARRKAARVAQENEAQRRLVASQ